VLNEVTQRGFIIDDLSTEPSADEPGSKLVVGRADPGQPRQVTVSLHVHGRHPVSELIAALSDLDYVNAVVASDLDTADD
jgi:hypothetical protein